METPDLKFALVLKVTNGTRNLGLATFCSQSFGTGRAEAENWIHIRRSAVVLTVALLFAGVAAAFCEPVLVALGQPPDVAAASASYAQVQAIGLPFCFIKSLLLYDQCNVVHPTHAHCPTITISSVIPGSVPQRA